MKRRNRDRKAYAESYYQRVIKPNPDKLRKRNRATMNAQYLRQFGLTLEEVEALKVKGCVLCGTRAGRLTLDHDHTTGKMRGILCHSCNIMIGYVERASKFGEKIEQYLQRGDNA